MTPELASLHHENTSDVQGPQRVLEVLLPSSLCSDCWGQRHDHLTGASLLPHHSGIQEKDLETILIVADADE